MKENKWLRLLTYMTGLVNQELLLQNEYLAAENKILAVTPFQKQRGHILLVGRSKEILQKTGLR